MNLNERGASVVSAVLILVILTALGVVFASLLSTGVEEATGEAVSTRALYLAEAGIETATGRLRKTPVLANWTWQDGYRDKLLGGGRFDLEVLEYESRDSALVLPYACEAFESVITSAGANPPRTIYSAASWASSSEMALELYDNAVVDCSNPAASANLLASSGTSGKPERIRYRITAMAPATLVYTMRITGTPGESYRLRIAHPQESAFGTGKTCGAPAGPPYDECMRALISLGKSANARRELFTGLARNP
ncbi:hypothetical protein BAC2_03550 [uncultured bacterium]|nr:hypothetical protein BAC2_03550 [uncultured bacterium]